MQTPTIAEQIPRYFQQPLRLLRDYDRANLRADVIGGLTVGVILLPQAIAFSLIAELPPVMGLYAAIIGGIIGAIWGSSNHNQTGPTNANSLLILSSLLAVAEPGTEAFIVAAGLMAVMAGVLQLVLGLARLGLLINFVSHSVVVGFASGAGLLIVVNQIRHALGLNFSSNSLLDTLTQLALNIPDTHLMTAAIGVGTIALLLIMGRFVPSWPNALITMVLSAAAVALFGLDERGVATIGDLNASLPPWAGLPFLDLKLIAELSPGALAVGAIGLVQTSAIARSISTQTGQRLDSNQEFVGQGLANIVSGLFSGYPVAGSFSRSAVNFKAGSRTPLAALLSALFVLVALFTVAPLAAFVPRAGLAGVLIVIGFGMIDRVEIRRIWQGAPQDAWIMAVTFFGTLFLKIEFAVLAGIMLSFAVYIMKTSACEVQAVLPSKGFKHFSHQPDVTPCPQLGVIRVSGDLYFGAVNHIEESILDHIDSNPDQRFLLLRMHQVNQCDFSGIHMLETIMRTYRDRGGDLYLLRVNETIMTLMEATGFHDDLGADHFLDEDTAIAHIFYRVLDPAVCIYECPTRVFKECQNLPKRTAILEMPATGITMPASIAHIGPRTLWDLLHSDVAEAAPLVVDVREPREFHQGHIPEAELVPLPELLLNHGDFSRQRPIIFVCRSGRRSKRAAQQLHQDGFQDLMILQGGMLAWEAAGLLEAVE